MLRADRAGGDTKTPGSRRALKLAQMTVGALREWRVDQAAEREPAGSHRPGIHHGHRYTAGCQQFDLFPLRALQWPNRPSRARYST